MSQQPSPRVFGRLSLSNSEKARERKEPTTLKSPKDGSAILTHRSILYKKKREKSIILFDLSPHHDGRNEDDDDASDASILSLKSSPFSSSGSDLSDDDSETSSSDDWSDYEDPSWVKEDDEALLLTDRARISTHTRPLYNTQQQQQQHKKKGGPPPSIMIEMDEEDDNEARREKDAKLEQILAQRRIRERIRGEVPLLKQPHALKRAQSDFNSYHIVSYRIPQHKQTQQQRPRIEGERDVSDTKRVDNAIAPRRSKSEDVLSDESDADTCTAESGDIPPTSPSQGSSSVAAAQSSKSPSPKSRSRFSLMLRGMLNRAEGEEFNKSASSSALYPSTPLSPPISSSATTRAPSYIVEKKRRTTEASAYQRVSQSEGHVRRHSNRIDLHACDATS